MITFITVSGLKDNQKCHEAKESDWANLVAKLVDGGRNFEDVANFTLKQAESVLHEQVEKFKNQARIQGCEFKDDNVEEVTNFSDGFNAMRSMFGGGF